MKFETMKNSKEQDPIAVVLFASTPEKNDVERLKNALFSFVERVAKAPVNQQETAALPQVAGMLLELIRKK